KTLREISGQRVDIGLIHFAQFSELGVGFLAVVQLEPILRERVANAAEVFRRQAFVWQRPWLRAENLREIDHGVTRDGESEIGLALAIALDANLDQRANIKDGRKRSDPGLIVVLRAKERENRIGEMALHQFGGPTLPILEELAEGFESPVIAVTPKQLSSGG